VNYLTNLLAFLMCLDFHTVLLAYTIRYDTIVEFNVDSKAEYTA